MTVCYLDVAQRLKFIETHLTRDYVAEIKNNTINTNNNNAIIVGFDAV